MAGTVVADTLQAASTSTLVIKNGVANTPPTIQDSAGTQIGTFCRAWVNFNGTTVTSPASMTGVNGSFNVSSVLDNGTNDYTVNFTTAMPDANYAFSVMSVVGTAAFIGNQWIADAAHITSTSLRVQAGYRQSSAGAGTAVDSPEVSVAIFR